MIAHQVEAYGANPARSISHYEYDHDVLGRRRGVIHTGEAFTASGSGDHVFRWKYNDRSELWRSDRYAGSNIPADGDANSQHAASRVYFYDPIGNRRESREGTASPVPVSTYLSNVVNEYTQIRSTNPDAGQGLGYDEDGNLIEAYVASDLNDDGVVDVADLSLMQSAYGNATCADPAPLEPELFYRADVNGNCIIDLADYSALLSNYGLSASTSLHARYYWDAENRLVEVAPSAPTSASKRVKFQYDYMSRRVEKRVYDWDSVAEEWEAVPSDHRRWVYFRLASDPGFKNIQNIIQTECCVDAFKMRPYTMPSASLYERIPTIDSLGGAQERLVESARD